MLGVLAFLLAKLIACFGSPSFTSLMSTIRISYLPTFSFTTIAALWQMIYMEDTPHLHVGEKITDTIQSTKIRNPPNTFVNYNL